MWPCVKKSGYNANIPAHLSFCPWASFIVLAHAILIWNRLLRSLKGSDGHNWILGIRIVFLEPGISTAVQCSCKPLTIMCCYHRRTRGANIFYSLRTASSRGSTYLLTPWSIVLFEKLNDSQLVKKFLAFYGTQRFIKAFTHALLNFNISFFDKSNF